MVYISGSRGNLAPSLVAMVLEADTLWPDRDDKSDGSIGDADHSARASDHNAKEPIPPGWIDALDLTYDPAHGADWFVHAEQLRLKRDWRIKYVIFFGQVFRSYGSNAWEWTPYRGENAHKAHMHVSVLPTGRSDTSPWFTAAAPSPLPEDFDMQWLIKLADDPAIWLTDFKTRRQIKSKQEYDDLVYLHQISGGRMLFTPESAANAGPDFPFVRVLAAGTKWFDAVKAV